MDDIYNEYDTLSLQKPNVSFGRFMDFSSHDFDFILFMSCIIIVFYFVTSLTCVLCFYLLRANKHKCM